MVATRNRDFVNSNRPNGDNPDHRRKSDGNRECEPSRKLPKALRFRDAADMVLEDERRDAIKRKLLDSMNRDSLESYRKSHDELKSIDNKKIRKFYEDQNEKLNDWLEVDTLVRSVADDIFDSFNPDRDNDGIPERGSALRDVGGDIEALLPEDERTERQKNARQARWAININVVANIVLLAAKIGAVFFSSSLSLIASLVDSALDLLCTLIIWSTNRLVQWRLRKLQNRFPVGRRRFEPIGILVFSIIMIVSFLQILQESFTKLLPSGDHTVTALPNSAIFAMVSTIVIKGVIGLGCKRFKSTQVQALAQDCKTDVYFNTLSLLFPAIGARFHVWWLDPLGAALLSLYIIFDWGETMFSNVVRLSGTTADDHLMRKLTFLAYRFSPVVKGFKSLVAYHAGDGVWAEVDVLLDGNERLVGAHDVAETMQYCFEGLKDVDRAFVSMDYTMQGPSGHNEGIA